MHNIIVQSIDTENDVCVFDCVNSRDPKNIETKKCTRTIAEAKSFIAQQKQNYEAGIAALTAEVNKLEAELAKFS